MKKLLTYSVLALTCISSSVFAETPSTVEDSSVTNAVQTMTSENIDNTSSVTPVSEEATVTSVTPSPEVTESVEKPAVTDIVEPKKSESVDTTSEVASPTKDLTPMTIQPALSDSSEKGGALGTLIFLMPFLFYIFFAYCIYVIAKKLGAESAWLAFVPVFNFVLILRIAGMSGWWILGLLVPLLNIYVVIKAWHGVSLRTGHDAGWTVGLILLGAIFVPLTAFTYQGNTVSSPATSV